MENLPIALCLGLLSHQNVAYVTSHFSHVANALAQFCTQQLHISSSTTIDLKECRDYETLVSQMIYIDDHGFAKLHGLVILQNLEAEMSLSTKNALVRVLREVLIADRTGRTGSDRVEAGKNRVDRVESDRNSSEPLGSNPDATNLSIHRAEESSQLTLGQHQLDIPEVFIICPIIKLGKNPPKIHLHIKEMFLFCQSVFLEDLGDQASSTSVHLSIESVPGIGDAKSRGDFEYSTDESTKGDEFNITKDLLLNLRKLVNQVYVAPLVEEYVTSLLVFTRSHRLTSLSPLTSRPSLRAKHGILDLARLLVVWNERGSTKALYVTPDYIKLAYRKICCWLVDWECQGAFSRYSNEPTSKKRLEIHILTGDWYGSDWGGASRYIEGYNFRRDMNSTTGFTNPIVDEVLNSVLPPL